MEWTAMNDGEVPPSDVTYNEWTQCDYDAWEATQRPADFNARARPYDCDDLFSAPGSYADTTMWSPRRGHAAVVHDQATILVLGGRAREHVRMTEDRNVGGIKTRPMQNDKFYSAWREASVLKNDVWASEDEGVTWSLRTPGCKVPQEDLILSGQPYVRNRIGGQRAFHDETGAVAAEKPGEKVNQHLIQDLPRFGAEKDQCASTYDCWGDATCEALGRDMTCVCSMWSPREHHAAVSHAWPGDGFQTIYVSGGFAAVRQRNCGDYACGDIDAASYRKYMNDVWKSTDGGVTWSVVTLDAAWAGRGAHTMVHFLGSIWVFNGQGGTEGQHNEHAVEYFADMWEMASDGAAWTNELSAWTATENGTVPAWPPRFGHTTVVEEPNAANLEITKLFLLGGRDGDGLLGDAWSWRGQGYDWVKDYAAGTAQENYLDQDSKLEHLVNVVPNNNKYAEDTIRRENFTTPADLRLLHGLGLHTVGDLANAEKRTILKLRGFDLPQVAEDDRLRWSEEKGGADGVCYMHALAKALVSKCHDIDETLSWVDGEAQLPRHSRPYFGATATSKPPEGMGQISEWHGVDYSALEDGSYHVASLEEKVEEWDGCSDIAPHHESVWPAVDVNTIGPVPQVERWRYDVHQQVMEITCKQHPLPRAFHTSVYFAQHVWVVGGKRDVDDHNNDLWYRDSIMPLSVLETTPDHDTSETLFGFKSNKEGSIYRYRMYWGDRLAELRPWSKAYVQVKRGGRSCCCCCSWATIPAAAAAAAARAPAAFPSLRVWRLLLTPALANNFCGTCLPVCLQEDVGWLKSYNDIGESSNTHTAKVQNACVIT